MDETVLAIIGIVAILTLVVARVVAMVRGLFHREMEAPIASTFMFIAWTRCDTLGTPTKWHPVAGGDDPEEMLTEVERYYPTDRYDRIVLPNGDRPDGNADL